MVRIAHQQLPGQDGSAVDVGALASIALQQVEGFAVVVASGEVDLESAPELRVALLEAARLSERIIVEMSEVTFLDSVGMGVLVGGLKCVHHHHQGTLCLVGPRGQVLEVLEITGLTGLFSIYASLGEAVDQLTRC